MAKHRAPRIRNARVRAAAWLGVTVLALGSGQVLDSGDGTAAAATISRSGVVAAAAQQAATQGYHLGIAVLDRQTHQMYTGGDAGGTFASESVVKTFIATELLLTGRMYGSVERTAYKMITQSDDASATALYGRVGGDNLINLIKRHYHLPGLGYAPRHANWWGNTHITAIGMVRFYTKIATDPKVGPWLMNAMHHATRYGSDGTYQYFGIPDATSGAAVKQGWGCDYSSGCNEADYNSTGFVNGDRYAVAMLGRGPLSTYNGSMPMAMSQFAKTLLPYGQFPPPAPAVTGMSFALSPTAGGSILTVYGRDFSHVQQVRVGSTPARFGVLSAQALHVAVPRHSAGPATLVVQTVYGTSVATSHALITYVAAPFVDHSSARYSPLAGGGRVAVVGTGFERVRSVQVGGVDAKSIHVLTGSKLYLTLPPHAAGKAPIVVTTGFGRSGGNASVAYVGAPTVDHTSALRSPTSGGSRIAIVGTGFSRVLSVRVGSANASALHALNDGRLYVTLPPNNPGAAPITVTTAFGRSNSDRTITYYAPTSSARREKVSSGRRSRTP